MTGDIHDDGSPLAEKQRQVKRYWFSNLPQTERDAIIDPHFETAHPSHEKKIEARKKFEAEQ